MSQNASRGWHFANYGALGWLETGIKSVGIALGIAAFAVGNMMLFSIPRYANGAPLEPVFQRLFDALNVLLAVPVLVYSASDFFTSAWHALRMRAVTLDVKHRDYIAAARMRGESTAYILFFEILPNVRGPLIVDFFLRLGYTTVAIGVLGFLGIGLPPPDPDWGGMVKETYGMIFVWPHMTLIPAAAISSLVIGFNFLATGLQEAARDG